MLALLLFAVVGFRVVLYSSFQFLCLILFRFNPAVLISTFFAPCFAFQWGFRGSLMTVGLFFVFFLCRGLWHARNEKKHILPCASGPRLVSSEGAFRLIYCQRPKTCSRTNRSGSKNKTKHSNV